MDVWNLVTNAQENNPSNTRIEVDVGQIMFMLDHATTHGSKTQDVSRGRKGRQKKWGPGTSKQKW